MSDSIDWSAVKERLRKSEQALQRAFKMGGKDLDEALRARAKTFSRRQRGSDLEKPLQLLTFRLGDHLYGWPLTDLAGVRRINRVTPLPEAPAELLGAVSYRGDVLALLCLKRLLGESCERTERGGNAVILRELRVACRVDELEGLIDLTRDQVEPLHPSAGKRSLIAGFGPGGLRILSGASFAQHSYFQTQEVRL